MDKVLIPAGHADKIQLLAGEKLRIESVSGGQVCDLFAFNKNNLKETLSPSHIRSVLRRTYLKEGDKIYSVLRRPMLKLVQDEVGSHDFSVPACDPGRYIMDFGIENHRSCRDNLAECMEEYNIPYEYLPDPLNLFQETSITTKGLFVGGVSPVKKGEGVVLEALMDLIVVGSACPQDKAPTNNYNPTDILFYKI